MRVDRRSILWIPLVMLVAGAAAPRPTQPEDELLDPGELRGELLRRGMADLLQAYLAECPPTGAVEKLIYERQQQLAVYADKSRDEDECLAALDKAIGLLEEAIAKFPADPRAMDWRLELGKDLIYKRAEPYYNNILFRGGSKEDRDRLLAITTRATQAFDGLIKVIERWDQRLQRLSEAALLRLENSGEIARYRKLEPQSRYFASWADFYRALATAPGKARDKLLNDIITYFTVEKKAWIETDHSESGVQCQSLLLLGMTYRLAGDTTQAVALLDRAVKRASRLTDPAEKRNLQWVVFLGKMERIKLLRDGAKYADALGAVKAITKDLAEDSQPLSVELALALLEGSIYRKQAEIAKAKKDLKTHAKLMGKSREPLIALAARRPKAKARIYSSLYPLLGKNPDPTRLGSFDKSVCVVGLLNDAARTQQRIEQLNKGAGDNPTAAQKGQATQLDAERAASLKKAIATAKLLLADKSELARQLRPEALFNLAAGCFQADRPLEAIRNFTRLVREHPRFSRARDAAVYAVQVAAELNRDPAHRDRPEVRKAFIAALRALTETFADGDEARYWQFYLANTLELAGKFREAAGEYAKVGPGHENYLDARSYRVNCLTRLFERAASSRSADQAAIRSQASKLVAEATRCAELIAKSLDQIEDEKRRGDLLQANGDCLLTAARLTNDPPLSDYRATLKILDGFEDRHGAYRDLIGRAMRLKIVALQGLDQLDQAKQLIPDYVKRDPENAGATLGALLASMQQEVGRARQRNQPAAARKAAAEAVDLARWLYQWAQDSRRQLEPAEVLGIRVQYAQACLEAEQYNQARALFQECLKQDVARSPGKEPTHGPTMLGLAESDYRLGQQAAKAGRYDAARESLRAASKRFLSVWRRTKRRTPLWWQALLRALEVPVELRELMVAQVEQARRGRPLTAQERDQLDRIPKSLAQVEQTINAERMGDPKLGGHARAFSRLLNRVTQLNDRVKRLAP